MKWSAREHVPSTKRKSPQWAAGVRQAKNGALNVRSSSIGMTSTVLADVDMYLEQNPKAHRSGMGRWQSSM